MNIITYFRGEYYFLSNFYPCQIKYKGMRYPSVENAYQAQKFTEEYHSIFVKISPEEAKLIGKIAPKNLNPEWENTKLEIMYDLIKKKFTENKELSEALLKTDESIIIENNHWGDTYWGKCNGVGENNLGEILMMVRNLISK